MATTRTNGGRRHPQAVLLGGGWAALLIGLGIWFTFTGAPVAWLFCGPWSVPGILLAVWGMQRH